MVVGSDDLVDGWDGTDDDGVDSMVMDIVFAVNVCKKSV